MDTSGMAGKELGSRDRVVCRECDRLPWGFPGQPAPVPVETHTRSHGCGFSRVQVMGLVKPRGSQTPRGLECPCPRLHYPNFIVIAITKPSGHVVCRLQPVKHLLVWKSTKKKKKNTPIAQTRVVWAFSRHHCGPQALALAFLLPIPNHCHPVL